MFCRLKDFRRIATRYDRLATNFLSAICCTPSGLVRQIGAIQEGRISGSS
jgi:transposase